MIRIVLTCLVSASLIFVGCDEPAKPAADPGAGAGAAPAKTTPPAKNAKVAAPALKRPDTKPVD
jgi:hypothetical protein